MRADAPTKLTPAQREAVAASLERLAEQDADPMAAIYARLFAQRPELEGLFLMGPNAKGHMLQEAFDAVLDWIGSRAYAPALLAAERVNHDNLGVSPDIFPSFFRVIADVVRDSLGADCTPPMTQGWAALLEELEA